MKSDHREKFDSLKRLADLSYEPIRDVSLLSPYHERVVIEKKYLEKKDKLRSILIMGHLQKMQLNAINNRSIQTMRKSKVAEEMSKKRYFTVNQAENSDEKIISLKIDNRKGKKRKMKTQNNEITINPSDRSQKLQMEYDRLIDDYLKQVSQQKLLQKGMDRKKIIQEACNVIKAQMTTKLQQLSPRASIPQTIQRQSQSQKRPVCCGSSQNVKFPQITHPNSNSNHSPNNNKPHIKSERFLSISTRRQHHKRPFQKPSLQRNKSHRFDLHEIKVKSTPCNRSVIDIECCENLKKLEKEEGYLSKQRMREEKLFLRKMKLIGMKNIRTLRSSMEEG